MHRHSSLALNPAERLPGASLLLVAFAVAVSLLPGMAGWLEYDRVAIAHGALWRLVTSHFVHWSGEHLFWDGLALGVPGWMCERERVPRFLPTIAAAAVLIPVSLWIAEPQMTTYRGLSGIDSTLFALLAAHLAREAHAGQDWSRLGLVALVSAGFAAKIGFELCTGGTLFVDSAAAGMTSVPLAHVVGGLIGLVAGIIPAPLPLPFGVSCGDGRH
jgi:rhomboid family GlyGly-CTERM serine protease